MRDIHPSAIINWESVTIEGNVRIGAYCTIGFPPEHKDVDPSSPDNYGIVFIGEGADIRNHVNIDAGTKGNVTKIGRNTMLMSFVHIGHDAQIEDGATVSTHAVIGGHSVVGKHGNIGLGAITHQYTEVGEGTILGAGNFAKGKLESWSKYHTGISAKNQGVNEHLLKKLGHNQIDGFNH